MGDYIKYISALPFAKVAKEKRHDSVFITFKNRKERERLIVKVRRENDGKFTHRRFCNSILNENIKNLIIDNMMTIYK